MPILKNSPEVVAIYEADPSINQSGLKEIMLNGIQSFLANKLALQTTEKYFEDKEHFLIGKAVDIKMSFDSETYHKVYHTSELTDKPSDTMMKVLHMTLNQLNEHPEVFALTHPDYARLLHHHLNVVEVKDSKTGEMKQGYYMNRAKENWREDGRMNDIFKPECVDYWIDIVKARGKQVLSLKEKSIVDAMHNSWVTHPYTAHLFADMPHIIRMYQVPVYFEINGIKCKGLVDKIDIDTEVKTVSPYDFKTMKGYTLTFPSVIRKRRYDLQGAFYYKGIFDNLLTTLSEAVGFSLEGYKINNMSFIVESTSNPGLPLVITLDDGLMYIGMRGDERMSGYEQLLDEYRYWASFDFNIEAALNQSHIHPGTVVVDSTFSLIKP